MNPSLRNTVSLQNEMIAYETLWGMQSATLKSLAEKFAEHNLLPSQLLDRLADLDLFEQRELKEAVCQFLAPLSGFSVCVHGAFQYPDRLRDARHPVELFYYRGNLGLVEGPCISIVGARKCTRPGAEAARELARGLVSAGYVVVSGLAAGIDTAAMKEAIDSKGQTIGVIGTPIDQCYPKENLDLQNHVANHHCLISQVPFYRYKHEPFVVHRQRFPQRNVTMSALSSATVIVEASDKSGTLTQARACFQQRRKLFIHNVCFESSPVTWPSKYEERGATRVNSAEEVLSHLEQNDES